MEAETSFLDPLRSWVSQNTDALCSLGAAVHRWRHPHFELSGIEETDPLAVVVNGFAELLINGLFDLADGCFRGEDAASVERYMGFLAMSMTGIAGAPPLKIHVHKRLGSQERVDLSATATRLLSEARSVLLTCVSAFTAEGSRAAHLEEQ